MAGEANTDLQEADDSRGPSQGMGICSRGRNDHNQGVGAVLHGYVGVLVGKVGGGLGLVWNKQKENG